LAWRPGVAIVGEVPQGLPPLTLPSFRPDLWHGAGGVPALLISIIGFVEASRSRRRWPPRSASASTPTRN
jgi:hypothetical protein